MSAIAKVELTFDGSTVTDFKSISENEIEVGKEVEYASKTGFVEIPPKYGFQLEYVEPKTGPFDFGKFAKAEGTAVIHYDGGTTATYYGVRLLKKGEKKADGRNEIVVPYTFTATRRDPVL